MACAARRHAPSDPVDGARQRRVGGREALREDLRARVVVHDVAEVGRRAHVDDVVAPAVDVVRRPRDSGGARATNSNKKRIPAAATVCIPRFIAARTTDTTTSGDDGGDENGGGRERRRRFTRRDATLVGAVLETRSRAAASGPGRRPWRRGRASRRKIKKTPGRKNWSDGFDAANTLRKKDTSDRRPGVKGSTPRTRASSPR